MINESKLKGGTLTLDALPFATQATNVRLVPSTDEQGEAVEVLSGDSLGADETTTWALTITAIQDFDDPAGFVRFSWDNGGMEVPFTWTPNPNGASFDGTVKVRPVEVGGDVNTRLTTEAEWACVGAVNPTWPVAGP